MAIIMLFENNYKKVTLTRRLFKVYGEYYREY